MNISIKLNTSKLFLPIALLGAMLTGFAQEENLTPFPPAVNDDTTKIKIGNMTIIFNENEDDFDDFDEDDTLDVSKYEEGVGLEGQMNIGANGWMTSSNQIDFSSTYENMNVDIARSRSFGFDFKLVGADLFNHRLFVSPGFGITWNSYKFKNNITMSSTDTTTFTLDTVIKYDKYKFRSTYIEIPLTIGTRIGNLDSDHVLTIEAGVIGGYNIGNIIKQKYSSEGADFKDKLKDDFNVNPFKLDAIASVKIGDVGLFARYSLTTMFTEGRTQEVYPFAVGITLGGI